MPSLAQVDVQNRVNLALPQLPQAVQAQGVSVQKRSSAFMMIIAVYSPDDRFSETYVSNYANLYVLDAIKRVPGANQSSIFGTPDYAMRIWLKPDRMASLGITATDVQQAVTNQNQQFAVGRIGQPPTGRPVEESFTLTTQGRLTDPAQFDNIILRAESGGAALVRLKDVGRAEYGLKDYSTTRTFNGKTASIMAVYQQPGANALEVSKAVRATLAEHQEVVPGRHRLRHRDGYDELHARVDRRGGADLLRGAGAGGAGRVPVPAQLPRHADSGAGGAGIDRRHVHRA